MGKQELNAYPILVAGTQPMAASSHCCHSIIPATPHFGLVHHQVLLAKADSSPVVLP